MEASVKKFLLEENRFGCTIKYYSDNRFDTDHYTSIEFEVKEDEYQEHTKEHLYMTYDTLNNGSFTNNFEKGDKYISGSVKWDGCSHYYFGDENGYIHLCGKEPVKQIVDVISYIHSRCGSLMKDSGAELLKGEFNLIKL